MKESFEVQVAVTAEDIAKGVRYDASQCPVALALTRMFPGYSAYVRVFGIELNGESSYRCLIAPEVNAFISSFDIDRSSKPTTLSLTFTREGAC